MVALVWSVVAASPGDAYNLAGCKWASSNIFYYDASTYHTAAVAAADDWTNASGWPGQYSKVSDISNAKVVIAAKNFGTADYDGMTYRSACYNGYYGYGGVQNTAYWNTYETATYTTDWRTSVMVHELGHALGLNDVNGSSCYGNPIMFYHASRYSTCRLIKPQTDDINGANAIY